MNLSKVLEENKKLKLLLEQAEATIKNLNEKNNELLKKIESLEEKLRIKRVIQIVPKSEKTKRLIVDDTENIVKTTQKSRAGEKHKKAFESVDWEKHVSNTIILEPDQKYCPVCGEKLIEFSENVKYVVNVVKQDFKVTKIIKKNFKCPNCNSKNGQIFYPLSNDVFGNSILTPSLASYIANMKFELGIPYHHLAKYLTDQVGLPLSKQLLAGYMEQTAELLRPIYDKMSFDLTNNLSHVIHADETPLVVKKRPNEDKGRQKSYVLLFSSSFYGEQINIYKFSVNRSSDNIHEFLKDFNGYLVCDDYSGYDSVAKLNKKIILQRCWVHARRNFENILKALPKDKIEGSTTKEIIDLIDDLFDYERIYRSKKLTPKEIKEAREKDHVPILKRIEAKLDLEKYQEGTSLYDAVKYIAKNWADLTTYLLDGHIEIHNNIAERAIKPFVVQRKVFMASNTYNGANIMAILFSIIRTAKINLLDVQAYLQYILENSSEENIETRLPYSKEMKEKFAIQV